MKKSFKLLTIAFGMAVIGMTASCNKEDNLASDLKVNSLAVTPAAVGDSVNFTATGTKGYLKTIEEDVFGARNFHQGTVPSVVDTTQWENPASTYYYDLGNNDGGTSSNYDFTFSGTANSTFTVNTAKYDLYFVNIAFGSVTSPTQSGRVLISTGAAGSNQTVFTPGQFSGGGSATGEGWYVYNVSNHIMWSYQPRTYILVSKTSGSSWKVRLNSVYWNQTRNADYAATNFPFMSFDYKEF